MYDLLIRGGHLVQDGAVQVADLAVTDGLIAALAPEISGRARREVDARGLHVFPGVVDAHVHFNEPGREHWEGLSSGSRALAAGGGTTFCDMPLNSHPPVVTLQALQAKREVAETKSLVDFALWGGLIPGNLAQLPELAQGGVMGFKAFMSNSGIPEFPAVDDRTLLEGLSTARELGLVVAVHAESEALTGWLSARIQARGGREVQDYLASRPVTAEVEAVGRALLFAEETRAPLHLVHLSSGRAVVLAAEARARGVDVSIETCPHYLFFTEADLERLGAVAKCAPPLRSSAIREELWQCVLKGQLDLIGSDHSPSDPQLKQGGDFFEVWGGIAGVQSTLAVLLTEGHVRRGLTLERVAALSSAAPARRFGLKGKGSLHLGADADIALIDLNTTSSLRAEDLHDRWGLSPYRGYTFQGRVQQTFSRGTLVYREGHFDDTHRGRFIRPERAARGHSSHPG